MESAHEWFYSRVAIHHKNERVSAVNEWGFYAKERVNKNRSSTLHGVIILFHTYWDCFLLADTFQR